LIKGGLVLPVRRFSICAAVLTVVTIGGLLPMVATVPAAQAAANEVLILGSTVTGGTSSLEAQEVAAQGLTPVVVDDATWSAMSSAQFATYRAIVLGDPTCSGTVPSAAVANTVAWGAAVTGNILINGTDPVFHAGQGGSLVTQKAIDFVIADSGKTGLYASLSCY
jgi:hypothetical protein